MCKLQTILYFLLFSTFLFQNQIALGNKAKGSKLTVVKIDANVNRDASLYYTTDNDLNTEWVAKGKSKYITYDLGRTRNINALRIAWGKASRSKIDFKIRVGATIKSLYDIYNGATSKSKSFQTYDFIPHDIRIVRISFTGMTESEFASIRELEVYGESTKISSTLEAPGEVMGIYFTQDLSNWKLNTAFDLDKNNKADEIKQPFLDQYSESKTFRISDDGKGVLFTAFVDGKTTKGSGYPRTELREMIDRGKKVAAWSSTEGKHVMEITQAVNHLPFKKKHVVIGQIHDADDDVIVFRLEDTKLFIDINGVDGPVLESNYELGTFFKVKFEVEQGKTKCFYNGKLKYTLEKEYENAYFKAGCYVQSSCQGKKKVEGERCSSFAEVEITDVWIRHE